MIISAFVMGFDFKFVEYLKDRHKNSLKLCYY
jgi:hypothetical protein